MNQFNWHPSSEHSELKQTVQEYADANHELAEDVYRAFAHALSE